MTEDDEISIRFVLLREQNMANTATYISAEQGRIIRIRCKMFPYTKISSFEFLFNI